MTADSSRVPRIDEHDLQRLREQLPTVRHAMDSVIIKLSLLKCEVATHVEVFRVLEESLVRRAPPICSDIHQ